jgi:hypothetical protein
MTTPDHDPETGEIVPPREPTSSTRQVTPRRLGRVLRSAGDDYTRPPVLEHNASDPIAILAALDDWSAWHDFLTERYGLLNRELREADHALAKKQAEARARVKTQNTQDRRTKDDLMADIVVWLDRNCPEVVERQWQADVALDALWKDLRNAERQIDRLRSHNSTANKTYDNPKRT